MFSDLFTVLSIRVWGWNEYRLDIPGQRYAVGRDGLNWLLIDDGSQVRLIVEGGEVSPAKKYELFFVAGGANASKRANDALGRWNTMVRAAR